MKGSISVAAPAKVNLSLGILGRREDGYHALETVMQAVTLSDILRITLGHTGGLQVICNHVGLSVGKDNLAYRAADLFCEETGFSPSGVEISIDKNIPVCAGTAGGSSDAAAVLRGLNELSGAALSPRALSRLGEKLGSDVPFCLMGGTALARGRGELLTPLPSLPPCTLLLCKPEFSLPTPELFARWDKNPARASRRNTDLLCQGLGEGDLDKVAAGMGNDFETVLSPEEGEHIFGIQEIMRACGAIGAVMSGSGPTVLGLFTNAEAAIVAHDSLKSQYPETFLAKPG